VHGSTGVMLAERARVRHHRCVDLAEYEQIGGFLRGLLVRLDDRLPAQDLDLITEFIDANELGLALEQMADALGGGELALWPDERADMLALAVRMQMGQSISRVLECCPSRPPLL
jgi:hypothetical protein